MTLLVGCTGHQSLPAGALQHIAQEIDEAIANAHGAVIGITSLAAGADQLFAERILRAGGNLRAVIPSQHYEITFGDSGALERYRDLLDASLETEVLPFTEPTEEAFLAAGKRVADLCEVLIAIWDGQPARGLGGTADVVDYARHLDRAIVVIWPAGVSR